MSQTGALAGLAAVFRPADPPREGRVAFWDPAGNDLPLGIGEQASLDLVVSGPKGVGTRSTPVIELPVAEAVPLLGRARTSGEAHPSAAFWGAAALIALQLVARGRLLPGVSPGGFDAWRVGPLDAADIDRVLHLAESMPPQARAIPLESAGAAGLRVPVAEDLVRAFLDAVADGMPRSPAAAKAHGTPLFAGKAPQQAGRLRSWADEVSAGLDTGVRISLRIELPESLGFRAVVQLHSLKDPTLVRDAAEVWAEDLAGFGPRARIDATLAIRRAARVWAPLNRLLDSVVPDRMELADEEVGDLLAGGAQRLSAAGVDLHWPRSLGRALTARAAITSADGPPSDMPKFFSGGATLDFSWQVALGNDPLTDEEMDRLAEATRPVVRLRDQWMLVDPELARKARERILKPVTPIDALSAALTGSTEIDGRQITVTPTRWLEDLRDKIADPDRVDGVVEAPAALQATLRDYQLRGLQWLVRMTSL
ncbi:MAG TPA: SNF2 helicase-associated domain-containing protein, partial [Kribbella sp.]